LDPDDWADIRHRHLRDSLAASVNLSLLRFDGRKLRIGRKCLYLDRERPICEGPLLLREWS
jgi:hypothetical protein